MYIYRIKLSCTTIGLLWTKQFYHYVMDTWVEGDPTQPPPPYSREWGRNTQDWEHLYNRDVVSMPDKWEYPWVNSTWVNIMQYMSGMIYLWSSQQVVLELWLECTFFGLLTFLHLSVY